MPSARARLPGPRHRSWAAGSARPRRRRISALAFQRLERAHEHRGRKPAPLGHRVEQAVHAVGEVDVGVAGLAVQRLVAPRGARRRVARRVGLADVRLGFDNRPGGQAVRRAMRPAPCRADRGRRRAWAGRRRTGGSARPPRGTGSRPRAAAPARGTRRFCDRAAASATSLLRSRISTSTRPSDVCVADDAEHLGHARAHPLGPRSWRTPPVRRPRPRPVRPGRRTCPTRARST